MSLYGSSEHRYLRVRKGDGMIYITSDTHGRFNHLTDFLLSDEITENDVLIILGDTGFNYDAVPGSGLRRKAPMNWYDVPILCIQGNHELRPHHIDTYREVEWNGGIVYREDKYPNLLCQGRRNLQYRRQGLYGLRRCLQCV